MESINNAVNAAAEAIWPSTNEQTNTTTQTQTGSVPRTDTYNNTTAGSTPHVNSSEEPLSGVLGNTKRGEPYDAGNKAEQDAALAAKRTSASSFSGSNEYTSGGNVAFAGSNNTRSNTNTYDNQNPAGTSEAAGAAGLNSSRVANTSVDDGSAGQTNLDAGRESYNPSGGATSSNASIASGRVAGGGSVDTPGGAAGGAPSGPPGGPPGGSDTSEIQKESHGEGTGEKYIRSTGLKADGGDFDAAREGAGREADRLLEEKGISVSKPSASHDVTETNPTSSSHSAAAGTSSSSHTGSSHTGSSFDETKEKKSLGEKIKEKLHHK